MGRRSAGMIALAGAALALTACSAQSAADQAPAGETSVAETGVHPISGLKVIPLTVASKGKKHSFKVELADTPEAQSAGLMFRTGLGDDEGMVFPSEKPTARSFWMKNTPLPLDIIFVGTDHRILNIAAMTEPYSTDPVYSVGSTSGVLELRGGRAAELGIEPGDLVEW